MQHISDAVPLTCILLELLPIEAFYLVVIPLSIAKLSGSSHLKHVECRQGRGACLFTSIAAFTASRPHVAVLDDALGSYSDSYRAHWIIESNSACLQLLLLLLRLRTLLRASCPPTAALAFELAPPVYRLLLDRSNSPPPARLLEPVGRLLLLRP